MTGPTPRQGFVGLCIAALFVVAGCDESNPEATVGIVTDEFMYARVLDERKFPFVNHRATGFGERCEIAADSSGEDITCYVDMQEGDIHGQTIKLQYNIPPEMCEYLEFAAYWYWNFEPGVGPESITVIKVVDAGGSVTSDTCLANGFPCGSLESEVSAGGTTCVYDLSGGGFPNCCYGGYTRTTTTITPTGSNTTVQEGKWNPTAEVGSCLSGPAVTDAEWPKSVGGIPVVKHYFTADTGLNDSLNVKSPIEVSGTSGNFHSANFFTVDRHNHSRPPPSGETSIVPYAIDPLIDRSGSVLLLTGQDAFEWRCLDRASEVKHRIRLYVRDWNTIEQFEAFRGSQGAEGNPDVKGLDGIDCDYDIPVTDCDDHRDWDDIVDELQAVYGPGTGYDDADPGDRPNFFPREARRSGQ